MISHKKHTSIMFCPTANGLFCIDPVTSQMNHKLISKTNYLFSKYDKNLDANRNWKFNRAENLTRVQFFDLQVTWI
jgi:hypothetical protein